MTIYTETIDGNLIGNPHKENLIEQIKETIKDYGAFSTGEVEASCSPIVPNQKGNLTHLVERFNFNFVQVEVYGNWENSIDSYNLSYEELDKETLEEILELCQAWQEINLEE
jgi:hypothetical protein